MKKNISMAFMCGFCDYWYKNLPIYRTPKWMDEQEIKDWRAGWNTAKKL